MIFAATLFAFICSLAIWCYASTRRPLKNGSHLQQAPDRLPLLGHAIKFLRPRHELFEWFVQCQRRFGFETIEITVPSLPPGVIVSDPINIEFILKNEQLISKGSFVKSRTADLFGHGIISANGELWKTQRKVGVKFFTGAKLESLLEDVLPVAIERVLKKLDDHAQDGSPVDLSLVFMDYTSFVMGQSAYDIELDSSHPFNRAFDYASDQTGRRFQNPLYPLTEAIFGSKFRSALSYVRAFGRKIVQNAKDRRSSLAFESLMTNEDPELDTLVDALLEAFGDRQIVADSVLNFLSAGKDTTAQALTWLSYLLMENPHSLASIRKEIEELTARSRKASGILELSMADLQPVQIPHLMAVIYESLRLYPPIPIEIQECQQSLTLPDGTWLPEGAVVVWCIWAMNRSTEIYGDDADGFRPGRWLKDGVFEQKSSFQFPVFNGGSRSCLGRRMAEVLIVYALIQILDQFDLTPESSASQPIPRRPENSLTLPMQGGLLCSIVRSGRR